MEQRIAFDLLVERLEARFVAGGMAGWVAAILARNCALCERDGTLSHGVFRVAGYLNSLRAEGVDGRAEPVIEPVSPSFLRIDAANGFAQPALTRAQATLFAMLQDTGVAVMAMRHSHHFSALWPDLEPFAEAGFVGLSMVTGGPAVIPPGATRKVYGTNPIAFATPVSGRRPLIMDFATSSMSQGDLRIARDEGRRVAAGTGTGRGGRATDDPAEILAEGGILPFGGHKGAALSLMVEILASAFTGGAFSHEVDFSRHPGAETPRTGFLMILVDPSRGGNEVFADRMAGLVSILRGAGLKRLPSDARYRRRDAAMIGGIPVSRLMRDLGIA